MIDLRLCRSLLFVPASNPRAVAKARTLESDLIVLDLEDSVRAEDKADARRAANEAASEGFGGRPVAIRINAPGTVNHGEDLVSVRRSSAEIIVLPKVESATQAKDAGWLTGKPVLAMIETARAVLHAEAIASECQGLIAGTNDLSLSLGIPWRQGRPGLVLALQTIVLAARSAGVAAFDGVFNQLEASEQLAAECDQGRSFGFDGKSVIHPSQIEPVNRAFSPSDKEIEQAQRLIEASTGGAQRHDGRMIEELDVEMARSLLAKARR